MKVTRPPGGNPYASAIRRPEGVRRIDSRDTNVPVGSANSVAPPADQDSIQVLGIPPEEFTPKVQNAITALMGEVEQLRQDLASAQRRLTELEELADMDTMLPIPNRRAFVRELNRLIRFAERYGTPSSLMFIDMNDLKMINDTYGHEAGDKALRHLARTLRDNLRGTDLVARLGGDEFGVLLAQADESTGRAKADNLAVDVSETPLSLGDQEITLKFAYGLYTFGGEDEAEAAITKADEAMYEHKREMKGEDQVR